MGMFLSMTGIIGKAQNEVVNSLAKYASSVGGGLIKEVLPIDNNNCCVIEETNGNTTIFNPYAYLEWDESAAFISEDLKAPVFSFHIHDGDFWMYILYADGVVADQFNPIPDYWDDDLSEAEINAWKGNASVVVKYLPNVKKENFKKYLVRWNLDADETEKAYPNDEFEQEDWQLLDFMKKLNLPYPLDVDGQPKGDVYKLWTEKLKLVSTHPNTSKQKINVGKKPWWKFW